MTHLVDIPLINIGASTQQLDFLTTGEEKQAHIALLHKEVAIRRGLKHEVLLQDKIHKVAETISTVDTQIHLIEKNERKVIHRIGYVFGGVGMALLCIPSWIAGIVAGMLAAVSGQGSPLWDNAAFLMIKPVQKCDMLFKQAFYSADSWTMVKKEEHKNLDETKSALVEFHKKNIKPIALDLEDNKSRVAIPSMKNEIEKLLAAVSAVEKNNHIAYNAEALRTMREIKALQSTL